MSEKQKTPLKKVVLVGIIFILIVAGGIMLGDVYLMKSEFYTSKLLFNLMWFSII